jgi:acyl-CoA synthetase (AMP-forming)/AMP-acid ligase II/thioesterase domain-containing protein/acyl carrier protein
VAALLDEGRAHDVALAAPARPALTYLALRDQMRRTVTALNGLGIGRNDTVAIVLPNGPELACAFLGIAAAASAAPLNPAYRAEDFRFYLSDLAAKALVLASGAESQALGVAAELRIPVLRIAHDVAQPAGSFTLSGEHAGPARNDGLTGADDVALVLHTSGTTARPKMVPLTQANLAASAHHIADTLQLSRADRCLNVMPLFHIHGLVAGILSSLAAGGSVFAAPCLNAVQFFRWLSEARPTWYTAVPTMHQAVLAEVERHRKIVDEVKLRFIRSSSSALPVGVMRKLEQAFDAPVIESYGMTEAAHQMTSNPLPPAVRKPGTVGRAAGPQLAIMSADGSLLRAGAAGEVVVRGPSVTAGYRNNAEANAQAFRAGWFLTGDQGVMDEEGYLTITGRLKEIINRGGEKVAPKEIDDALMEHAGVAAAAAFPLPHPTLGEEIGAAVVAAERGGLGEASLRQFLAGRLPPFKIPRRFVFVDEIPTGPTGKIQRHELAAALGLSALVAETRAVAAAAGRAPTALEASLQALWAEALGVPSVGLHDNFFLLGGDSLQAVQLMLAVEETLGHALAPSALIECGTVAEMAALIRTGASAACIVPVRASGARPPLFCVHGASGHVLHMRNFARYLDEDQPFYAIQSVGVDGKDEPFSRIEDMAAHYIVEMRRYQPRGPYYLGGYSMGAWVAFEMARQLRAAGDGVAFLALIDSYSTNESRRATILEWSSVRWREFRGLPAAGKAGFLAQRALRVPGSLIVSMRKAWGRWRLGQSPAGAASAAPVTPVEAANHRALHAYKLRPLHCDAVLFKTRLVGRTHPVVYDGWRTLIVGELETRRIPGGHRQVFDEPFVRTLAREFTECLARRQPCATADGARPQRAPATIPAPVLAPDGWLAVRDSVARRR